MKILKALLPVAVLITYIVMTAWNILFGMEGDMTDFILGLILIMIYARSE
jgi:hypothetical protein